MSLVAPLILCAILTAIWIYTLTAKENISKNIKRIAVGGMLAWGLLPFVVSWLVAISNFGIHLPWGPTDELNHLDNLWEPFLFIIELVFLSIVFRSSTFWIDGDLGLSENF